MCALVVKRSLSERWFNKLHGLISIYKPPSMGLVDIENKLKHLLVKTFNEQLPTRPVEDIVKIDDNTDSFSITKNLADSPLAVGPRFIRTDFRVGFLNPLPSDASGVQICSINDIHKLMERVDRMSLMKVYHVQGRLGVATDNFSPDGKIIEKSTYNHVTRSKIDRLMSAIQSTYQREMFNYFGIDLKSQKAFNLASSGLLRPKDAKTPPIIYSIRCIKYYKPFFTIEMHVINEKIVFLKELIHDIGYRLKTNAICTQIRRVRDGFADVNSSLVYLNLNNFDKISENMTLINKLAYDNLNEHNKSILVSENNKPHESNALKKTQNRSDFDTGKSYGNY